MYTFILKKNKDDTLDIDSATLVESIKYNQFMYFEKYYDYLTVNTLSDIPKDLSVNTLIPIGTIEWVLEFIDFYKLNKENFKPLYYPTIQKHLKIMDLKEISEEMKTQKELFIKEMNVFKSVFADNYGYIFNQDNMYYLSQEKYFVSEKLNIQSEYRLFIFQNEIKGIYNYDGDFLKFPTEKDISMIKKTIVELKELDNTLKAYTLDIALTKDDCHIIEVHPFFSCGLYGFDKLNIIPQMYISGFKYLIQ